MAKLVDFYEGKTVFATGLTGCLGVALTEKLIRATKVKKVYALVRASPGKAQERLEECWDTSVPLCAASMKADGRVVAVRGDVTGGTTLGMEQKMLDTIRAETAIVLNLCADINLTKSAAELAITNILGALAVAELAKSFPTLERFTFASTLYSQTHLANFDEEVYALDTDPEEELKALMSGKPILDIAPWLFEYAYTQNLVERLLVSRYPQMPMCIIRPSVVGSSLAEPTLLWTYLASMPVLTYWTLCSQISKKHTIVLAATTEYGANFFDEVPVDLVVNLLLSHTAAGTIGPVHANTAGQPCTQNDMSGDLEDLFPPHVWCRNTRLDQMKGLAKLYKSLGMEHPRGSDTKTRNLVKTMSTGDLEVFPIDLDAIDLKAWHRAKSAMFRKQVEQIKGVVSGELGAKL